MEELPALGSIATLRQQEAYIHFKNPHKDFSPEAMKERARFLSCYDQQVTKENLRHMRKLAEYATKKKEYEAVRESDEGMTTIQRNISVLAGFGSDYDFV